MAAIIYVCILSLHRFIKITIKEEKEIMLAYTYIKQGKFELIEKPKPELRGSREWEDTYKIRVNVEKSINHFKDSFCIANRKTQNEKTLHADLLLAGITQLVTVLVADKIHKHQYIRSLKPLIA